MLTVVVAKLTLTIGPMVCGKCRKRWYCSRECQVKDWSAHKLSCNTLNLLCKMSDHSGNISHNSNTTSLDIVTPVSELVYLVSTSLHAHGDCRLWFTEKKNDTIVSSYKLLDTKRSLKDQGITKDYTMLLEVKQGSTWPFQDKQGTSTQTSNTGDPLSKYPPITKHQLQEALRLLQLNVNIFQHQNPVGVHRRHQPSLQSPEIPSHTNLLPQQHFNPTPNTDDSSDLVNRVTQNFEAFKKRTATQEEKERELVRKQEEIQRFYEESLYKSSADVIKDDFSEDNWMEYDDDFYDSNDDSYGEDYPSDADLSSFDEGEDSDT